MALGLALVAAPAGPPAGWPDAVLKRAQASPGAPAGRWFAHGRPLAAVMLVADARSDRRLLAEAVALLQGLRFSVLLVDDAGLPPERAVQALQGAWQVLRRRSAGVPLALAGHGFGATLATVLADGLEADERPQLLWLLAPGRVADADAPLTPDLKRPDAALARVDALCVGTRERATQVLLLHGAQDALVPAERTRALADAAPGATLYRVPAAGHHDLLAPTEVRERLGRLLLGWTVQARRRADRPGVG